MRIWRTLDEVPADLGPHGRHHRQLRRRAPRAPAVVTRAREVADELRARRSSPSPSTRTRSPCSVPSTRRGRSPRSRSGPRCSARPASTRVLALPFTREIAGWSPEEFVDRMLVAALHAAAVVVGANFRFGHRAAGDVGHADGRRRASEASPSSACRWTADPQVWSSTYVRTCLAAGDVEGAAEALGRPFTVRGVVVSGDERGRELGSRRPTCRRNGRGRAGRRGVRRVAAAARHRRALPGRDQRRHQPDVRRRARPPGRGLRARPRRPRALRRRGRGRVRRAAPWDGALRRGRRAGGHDERRRAPAPASCWRPEWPASPEGDAAASAEPWFLEHGLP